MTQLFLIIHSLQVKKQNSFGISDCLLCVFLIGSSVDNQYQILLFCLYNTIIISKISIRIFYDEGIHTSLLCSEAGLFVLHKLAMHLLIYFY